jgi:hypothetical protein
MHPSRGSAQTDASVFYEHDFVTEGRGCHEGGFSIHIDAWGFRYFYLRDSGIRCTDKVQTLDFQLERETT